ncbi:MAG: GspH/FimT family protein [Rhodocyclaceae bacterium]|nr:GspH/FimT family protein [Rhodocyclaceae bacterium]
MLKMRAARGLSLIEVIIVIVLIGFLLITGLPAFSTMLANQRIRSVADAVLAGLQTARIEAMKRNQNVTFTFDPDSTKAWQITLPDSTVLQSMFADQRGSVAVVPWHDVDQIVFNNLGRRTTPSSGSVNVLNIDIRNPAIDACETEGGSLRCLRITVGIGGELRLCDPKRPAGDPQAC